MTVKGGVNAEMTLSPRALPAPSSRDSELLTRARSGDLRAREDLIQQFRKPVFIAALQMVGNREDALDVTQDSLLRFFSTLDRFEEGRPIKPWLLTIARNRARDLLRRRKVRKAEPLPEENADYHTSLIDHSANPETNSRRAELRRNIWRALGELPQKQREILVLRDYQDLSYAEIASVLGIPVGTVMSRLHRARSSLRRLLEDEYGPALTGEESGERTASATRSGD